MCLVLVTAVLLGYVVRKSRAQRQAVAEIRRLHGIFSKELKGLTRLSLGKTNVTDVGLAHLEGLSALQRLELNETRITDAGLRRLMGLRALRVLLLDGTAVTVAGRNDLLHDLPQVAFTLPQRPSRRGATSGISQTPPDRNESRTSKATTQRLPP
jgi:hypothetical protein